MGYVISTNVTVFETCFEKVLSNTSPYMPPSLSATSKLPMDTFSASHLPTHATDFMPSFSSFSTTDTSSFLNANRDGLRSPFSSSCCETSNPGVVGGSGGFEVGSPTLVPPGCLKTPKLSDFLCGCMLQEIVLPAETLIHRIKYDCRWIRYVSVVYSGLV